MKNRSSTEAKACNSICVKLKLCGKEKCIRFKKVEKGFYARNATDEQFESENVGRTSRSVSKYVDHFGLLLRRVKPLVAFLLYNIYLA